MPGDICDGINAFRAALQALETVAAERERRAAQVFDHT